VAAIAGIGNDAGDGVADQAFHLGQDSRQGMAVVGASGQGHHMGDELAALGMVERGGD